MAKNYYQILEISEDAGAEEIRKSYRRLVLRYHPDRNGGNTQYEAIVKEIYRAYSVLSVPSEREKYDESLKSYAHPFNSKEGQPECEPENNGGSFQWNFTRFHFMILWFAMIIIGKATKLDNHTTRSSPDYTYLNNATPGDTISVGDRFFGNLDNTAKAGEISRP